MPKLVKEGEYLLNIFHTLHMFNDNLYDYCCYHKINNSEERDYLYLNMLFIKDEYMKSEE